MKFHERTVHLRMKDHECPSCGRAFSQIANLTRHIKTVHRKGVIPIRDHECDLCGKTFGLKATLTRHLKNVHRKGVIPIIIPLIPRDH